jgi:hypothetical protein
MIRDVREGTQIWRKVSSEKGFLNNTCWYNKACKRLRKNAYKMKTLPLKNIQPNEQG